MSLLLFALSRFPRYILAALTLCTLAALQVACGGGGNPRSALAPDMTESFTGP